MKTVLTSRGAGLSQAETTTAVENALTSINADDIIATRHHDCSVTNINGSAGALVELRQDNATAGTSLPAAVKKIHISCTFGEPIEILSGANSGSATRKAVLNLGEGPLVLECKMTSGHSVFVRSLSTNSITSGVLTVNFLG